MKGHDEVTGLPIDKFFLECDLPDYLQESVLRMKMAWEEKNVNPAYIGWDGPYCELQSNINVAEVEQDITTEQAWYLREKYLYLRKENMVDI